MYNLLIDQLEDLLDLLKNEDISLSRQKQAIEAALKKLKKYYSKTSTSVFSVSTGE